MFISNIALVADIGCEAKVADKKPAGTTKESLINKKSEKGAASKVIS